MATKPRFFLTPSTALRTSLILLAGLLAACAPAATPTQAPLQAAPPTVTLTVVAPPTLTLDQSPTQTPAPTPLPIATSRGPHLEATDPQNVSMASGGLQFVEFFEFW